MQGALRGSANFDMSSGLRDPASPELLFKKVCSGCATWDSWEFCCFCC